MSDNAAIVCPHCSVEIKLASLAKYLEASGYPEASIVPFGIYQCACGGQFNLSSRPTVTAIPTTYGTIIPSDSPTIREASE